MSTYFEKIATPWPWGGGVHPYGQPDRKKTGFFLTTALTNWGKKFWASTILSNLCSSWRPLCVNLVTFVQNVLWTLLETNSLICFNKLIQNKSRPLSIQPLGPGGQDQLGLVESPIQNLQQSGSETMVVIHMWVKQCLRMDWQCCPSRLTTSGNGLQAPRVPRFRSVHKHS